MSGSPYWNIVQDQQGNAVVGVNVAVLPFGANTSTQPGFPLSSIFSDVNLTVPLANPLRTDVFGRFQFFAGPGIYLLQVYGGSPSFAQALPSYIIPIVLVNGSGTVSPGGSDTDVQLNNVGFFYGDGNFTYNLATQILGLNGTLRLKGSSSGFADISVAAAAGSPNKILVPTSTGSAGQLLSTDGGNPQQLSWVASPQTIAAASHQWLKSYTASTGLFTQTQPAAADLSDGTTGSGLVVLNNTPTLITPILGTPTSVTLTNATGLPLTTGVTGILPQINGGTGVSAPALVAGNDISLSGSWPNNTISVKTQVSVIPGAYTSANITVDAQGIITSVSNGTGGIAAGPSDSIQYNNGGVLGGSALLTFDPVTGAITFAGSSSGSATMGVAAAAGTPNRINLPTTTGTNGQVLTTDGGTPQQLSWTTASSFNPMTTLGDIIYENATPAPARLAGNTTTTKEYLSQTGNGTISAAPAWAQVAFADLSGSIAIGQTPLTTLGDTLYVNATPALARLAGNTTTTKEYLSQTGNGTISAAPVWAQIAYADISGTPQLPQTIAQVSHKWLDSYTASTGLFTQSQPAFTDISGSIAIGQTPLTTLGDILYANATPALARLAGNTTTTKEYLSQTGNGTISAAPAWAQIAAADLSDGTTGTGAIVLAGSPALTGTPTAPTAGLGTNTTQIATTAFVATYGGVPRPNTRRWAYLCMDGVSTITNNATSTIGIGDKIFFLASGTGFTNAVGTATLPVRAIGPTGSSSNAFARVSPGAQQLTTGRNLRMETYVRLQNYTNPARLWIGMFDTTPTGSNSPASANYYAFRATQGTDTNYKCITAASGTQTVTDSGVAVDTSFHKFEIIVTDSIPNVKFYIDGSLVATNTTHVPASGLLFFWMNSLDLPSGTTTQSFEVAWIYHEEDF